VAFYYAYWEFVVLYKLYNMQDNKHIKTLIAGLLANNDARVEQITERLVDSLLESKQDVLIRALNNKFQRNSGNDK
jgi:hypothetical protein